jgi:ribosomal protein S12 methylthiotransferase accessory factor
VTDPIVIRVGHGPADYEQAVENLRPHGGAAVIPLICVGDGGMLGPYIDPAEENCVHCLVTRLTRAAGVPGDGLAAHFRMTCPSSEGSAVCPTEALDDDDIASAVRKLVASQRLGGPERYSYVHFAHGRGRSRGYSLPLPSCRVCGARVRSGRRHGADMAGRLHDDGTHAADRILRPEDFLSGKGRVVVDRRVGVVKDVRYWSAGEFYAAEAEVSGAPHPEMNGYGTAATPERAGGIAVLEAVERCGWTLPGDSEVIAGSYDRVAASAPTRVIEPPAFGLYAPAAFDAQASLGLVPYSRSVEIPWVRGYSMTSRAGVLVPLDAAFHGPRTNHVDLPTVMHETSNGSAVGGSLVEAALYGLLEVLERDAVLRTWYERRPATEITVDEELSAVLAGVGWRDRVRERVTEGTLRFFDLAHGVGVHEILVVHAGDLKGVPARVIGAASRCDPASALLSAVHETMHTVESLESEDVELLARRARAMAEDPYSVVSMKDHATLHIGEKTVERLDFLLSPGPVATAVPFREWAAAQGGSGGSPRTQYGVLTGIVERLGRSGHDVVLVDQTSPSHSSCGLVCCKVLVTQMYPMTFGHRQARLPAEGWAQTVAAGGDAVLSARDERLEFPHPFP